MLGGRAGSFLHYVTSGKCLWSTDCQIAWPGLLTSVSATPQASWVMKQQMTASFPNARVAVSVPTTWVSSRPSSARWSWDPAGKSGIQPSSLLSFYMEGTFCPTESSETYCLQPRPEAILVSAAKNAHNFRAGEWVNKMQGAWSIIQPSENFWCMLQHGWCCDTCWPCEHQS